MGKNSKFVEKALISAIEAGMFGLGMIAFLFGAAGILVSSVNFGGLFLGYLFFCGAIWLVLMLPYMK